MFASAISLTTILVFSKLVGLFSVWFRFKNYLRAPTILNADICRVLIRHNTVFLERPPIERHQHSVTSRRHMDAETIVVVSPPFVRLAAVLRFNSNLQRVWTWRHCAHRSLAQSLIAATQRIYDLNCSACLPQIVRIATAIRPPGSVTVSVQKK